MADWITGVIGEHGYLALFALMFLENIFPPIPSELILPFAGYAAAKGDINPIGAVMAGSTARCSVLLLGMVSATGLELRGASVPPSSTAGGRQFPKPTSIAAQHGSKATATSRCASDA